MANNKSIQILRGSTTFDPTTSDQVLLDGQPFYSKKDGKLRIGKQDKKIKELDDVAALNLDRENGSVSQKDQIWNKDSLWDGADWSLIKGQKVPGANASGFQSAAFGGTRYDYINYGPDGTDGDSAANGSTVNSSANAYNRTPTSAEGNQSFAVGGSSHAYGDWAVAMGKDVKAYQSASISLGGGTKAGMTFDEWKTIYGNGDPNFTEDTKITIAIDGVDNHEFSYKDYYSFAVALGDSAKAYQRSSVAIGKDAKAYAWNAIAIGRNAIAGVSGFANEGDAAIALGSNAKATKYRAIALGEGTASGVSSLVLQSGKASGSGSIAIRGIANGDGSIAIGPATANRNNSFAIGLDGTTADNYNSFAIGRNAKSTADTSFSFGWNVTSSANAALAVNEGTQALHKQSLAAGFYTKTGAQYQAVFGKYNEGKSDTIFEVGNGNSTKPSNAFEVLKDGRAKVQSTPVDNDDVVRLKELSLLTQEQVDLLF